MLFMASAFALCVATLHDPILHTPLPLKLQEKFLADINITRPLVYFDLADRFDKLVIPPDVATAYAMNPRGTIALLYRVTRDGKPLQSITACGYALGLLNDPSFAIICSQVYKGATSYDEVDVDWRCSPRNHWLRRIRTDMKLVLSPIKPD